MDKKRLGQTDLYLTPLGIGTGESGYQFWSDPLSRKNAIEVINHALDSGINWIDTAALYGRGAAEEVIGVILAAGRNRPYIVTKCSLLYDSSGNVVHSLKAASIRKEIECSLKRLGVDTIDMYLIHWPIPEEDIEEGWETLCQLKDEGKVRYIGISNFTKVQMERISSIASIDLVQVPYSLIDRQVEKDVLPFCLEHGIGVLAYSPVGVGLLSGRMTRERIRNFPENDWRKDKPEFKEPLLSQNLMIAEKTKEIGAAHNCSAVAVAIKWVLQHQAVTSAIAGARSPEQLDEILIAPELILTSEEKAALDELTG